MPTQNIFDFAQLVRTTAVGPFVGVALIVCAIAVARLRAGRF